jgi:hypothetical protein
VLLNGAKTATPGSDFSTFINSAILAGPSPPPVGSAATVDAALASWDRSHPQIER